MKAPRPFLMSWAKGKIAIPLTLLLGCALSQADAVRVQDWRPAACEPASVVAPLVAQPPADCRLEQINWLLGGAGNVAPVGVASPWPAVATGQLPETGVTELPPPPSSLALVLSGLASFVALPGLRSLRRLHLGHLPDWYHADAVQVGHTTPLSIDFDHAALPACVFELPSDLRPQVSYRIPREPVSRLCSQFFLLIESPRGPPSW
jgi:hypothetical protein